MQYDLAGSPLGARKSLLNAYATSGYGNASSLDLARTAILTPLLKLNLTLINREWGEEGVHFQQVGQLNSKAR